MVEKLKKVKNLLLKDKKVALLLILALTGVLFLIISDFIGADDNKIESEEYMSTDEYAESIENKLENIISSVDGAGETVVMVTLESREENIYAKEIKSDEETDSGKSANKYEYEYVIIKSGSSAESGMLLKVIEPGVRGVAIVCDGGDNAAVRENIINTVSAVLDIKTNKISVCKRKS